MDFNTNSLSNRSTALDIERQGITLYEGMPAVFYDRDGEDGKLGYLHVQGTVYSDAQRNTFWIDFFEMNLRFTPGDDLSVLDAEYPE
jgi:hypothetical protein